jgi:RHS repeat-associated protein
MRGSGLEERLYVQQDANWNTTALTDASGAMQQRFTFDPYGKATARDASTWASTTDVYMFLELSQGSRSDSVTGLVNSRMRDRNVDTGRWQQADPATYIDGPNRYQALDSSPVQLVDPGGLIGFPPGYTPPSPDWSLPPGYPPLNPPSGPPPWITSPLPPPDPLPPGPLLMRPGVPNACIFVFALGVFVGYKIGQTGPLQRLGTSLGDQFPNFFSWSPSWSHIDPSTLQGPITDPSGYTHAP